jgi:hypothetical protein
MKISRPKRHGVGHSCSRCFRPPPPSHSMTPNSHEDGAEARTRHRLGQEPWVESSPALHCLAGPAYDQHEVIAPATSSDDLDP